MRDLDPAFGIVGIVPAAGEPEFLRDLKRDLVDVPDRDLAVVKRVDPLLKGVVAALLDIQAQRVHELEVRELFGEVRVREIEERQIFHAL